MYADENILYFNEDSCDVVFNYNEMTTIILVRLLAWHIKLEKRKELKKKISEELMPIAWDPNRWWNLCVPEDEKKVIEPIFTG